eukprot:CAMPEP_0182880396 /NCGR_PEP_ID=MMETSP0034_2-20130328/16541_1 /TAXON_ID=156128 /ORGANISM="Nephroselmis pyriformis, Strain CCMP717" /LENGTH=191 /DNA_ID=CAMNT_0025013377 /DNA_START=8 /DNA_END=580 /DNA_ORIENTATION=+
MGAAASTDFSACRYVCHQCGSSFRADRGTVSTCIRCNGTFIEQMQGSGGRVTLSREVLESLQTSSSADGSERMDATELLLNLSAFGGLGIMHYSPLEEEQAELDEAVTRSLEQAPSKNRPAPSDVKGSLKWIKVDQAMLDGGQCTQECAICWEDVEDGDKLRELPCKHEFHHSCLLPWLDMQDFCPVCRRE